MKLFLILENGVCLFPWNIIIKQLKTPHPLVLHMYITVNECLQCYEDNTQTSGKYQKYCFASIKTCDELHMKVQCDFYCCQIHVYSGASIALCTVRAPGLSRLKQGCT